METQKVAARVFCLQRDGQLPTFDSERSFHVLPREGEYIPMQPAEPLTALNAARVAAVVHDASGPVLYVYWNGDVHTALKLLLG